LMRSLSIELSFILLARCPVQCLADVNAQTLNLWRCRTVG
jgi:hypothetical protein